MRIIHTSDWHLGQHFFGKSREAEHQAFLRWLLAQITLHQVDALIVAGDIFDIGSPPSYARRLYNQFIAQIQGLNCRLVILAGNHDSVATLNESHQLLACLHTDVIANVKADLQQQVLVLNDKQGKPAAIVCAIPFLRQNDVVQSVAGQSAEQKQAQLQQAIADHYQQVFAIAKQKQQQLQQQYQQPLAIIATGHLTTVGATGNDSESVREIYIGSLQAFGASAFPPADYIALGHIHKSQIVAKSEHIRYSGSPIPLSFDELGKPKSVCLVDFEEGKFSKVSQLEVPMFQQMLVIKGDLDSITRQITDLGEQHLEKATSDVKPDPDTLEQPPATSPDTASDADPELTTATRDHGSKIWLEIALTSGQFLPDINQRIETLAADYPLEILRLKRDKAKPTKTTPEQQPAATLTELSVDQVFEKRLAEVQFDGEQAQQQLQRIRLNFKVAVAAAQLQLDQQVKDRLELG